MNRYPSFDEALSKFREFLEGNGYGKDVVWVTSDDVLLSTRRLVYVKVPAPASNEKNVRQLFDSGVAQGMGILLDTVCECGGTTFSYAWVPRHRSEAQQALMPSGLKMSAQTGSSRVAAKTVKSTLRWSLLRFRYLGQQRFKSTLFR
jgi:hypothetical protein